MLISYSTRTMHYTSGIDIYPSLTSSPEDRASYSRFLRSIQETFATDPQVISKIGYYDFIVGELAGIPRDGTKFLTFSSRVTGRYSACADRYIRKVYNLARMEFGVSVSFLPCAKSEDDVDVDVTM